MKVKKIKINDAKAEIYSFFSKEEFLESKSYLEVMGFKNEEDFNNLLGKLVSIDGLGINEGAILKVQQIIEDTLNLCWKVLKTENIKIFMFGTKDEFITSKMGGSSGFCTNKECLLLLINLKTFTEVTLKNTLAHELAHAINSYYDMGNMSIGQGIVFDGLAENFREDLIDKKKSAIVSTIKEGEIMPLFNKIRLNINSVNHKDYYEVFYGTGKYPLWTGYALGYYLIKNYISEIGNKGWEYLLRENPKIILSRICKKNKQSI